MPTQIIRAFFLAGLVLVAHLIQPFSLKNLTAFGLTAVQSVSQVLPQKTLSELHEAGLLATVATSGWGEQLFSTNAFAPKSLLAHTQEMPFALQSRLAKTTSQKASGFSKISERAPKGFLADNKAAKVKLNPAPSSLGGAPLPFVPGIESSLIPSTTFMALPKAATISETEELPEPLNISQLKNQFVGPNCPQLLSEEKLAKWVHGLVIKQVDPDKPATLVKTWTASQTSVNGKACIQPGQSDEKAGQRAFNSRKQSC